MELARPLHIQRLERALTVEPFLDYAESILEEPLSDDSLTECKGQLSYRTLINNLPGSNKDCRRDRAAKYNLIGVRRKREWLQDVLLSSSSSSSSEEYDDSDFDEDTEKIIKCMIKEHRLRKHYQSKFHQNEGNQSYMYYGAGLLSRIDRYPEHQKYITGHRRKKTREKCKEKENKKVKKESPELNESSFSTYNEDSFPDDASDELTIPLKVKGVRGYRRERKTKKMDIQARALHRHKLWTSMAKKEVGRCQKAKANNRKEVLQNCKRMATSCMRVCRQKALQSQKTVKEKIWLLKRLTRTMQAEWKKFDRIIKEQNKRAEKEAEEQRKIDKEILEVRRQQRKVNFLITLPELYAHFMKNKMNSGDKEDATTNDILQQLESDASVQSFPEDFDSDTMKEQALRTAQEAYNSQQNRLAMFGSRPPHKDNKELIEHPQPAIFKGQLKTYQLKGMNWLANLYYFGINGILADEMGLGKTVQSVAFLAHICEVYDTWGPFLIVTPASTLHNWTAETSRFVPQFKMVPYWGNPDERKNLRKFFDSRNLGSKDASFHVVITSYQIVIQDFKFLNRLKWNYMILDEAQALKSINSQRWKQLLGFSCRNRLLLSGTPIQNSMSELWALLHFIMPTLFDSHSWFNEWFSKDIEGHVENKTHIDEKHLNRLHMILKPFMLRRVKSEVENELSAKIEIMMYCPLTLRQKYLYSGLKNKISIDELLNSSMGTQSQQCSTTLMNLVMQFRKVCNHPELLERREVRSPFVLMPDPYVVSRLVFKEGILRSCIPSTDHILYNMLFIFHPENVFSSCFKEANLMRCFSFLAFLSLSPTELHRVAFGGWLAMWHFVLMEIKRAVLRLHRRTWNKKAKLWKQPSMFLLDLPVSPSAVSTSDALSQFVFTSGASSLYTFGNYSIHHIPETLGHRMMRASKLKPKLVETLSAEETKMLSPFEDSPLHIEVKKEEQDDDSAENGFEESAKPLPKVSSSPKKHGPHRSPRKHKPEEQLIEMKELIDSDSNVDIKPSVSPVPFEDDLSNFPEFPHKERPSDWFIGQPLYMPKFLLNLCPKSISLPREMYCYSRSAAWSTVECHLARFSAHKMALIYGSLENFHSWKSHVSCFLPVTIGGSRSLAPPTGWSNVVIPDKHSLIMDAGKLYVLDALLSSLKAGGHRVLIYSQMTKMIDLLEEYMWHRQHKYIRLDGSSKISDRRDMVTDFQNRSDIFVFLLSTRAGGVGINLTAADTVIFYDSDWNPTVDQQAMDRTHRLGQTKQVTVYRLICKSTIEERILQRATEKSEIQRMVISGGNFRPDTLKPKEVVSLLLEDDIEKQYRAKQAERRLMEDQKLEINREKMRERMRKRYAEKKLEKEMEEKRRRVDENGVLVDVCGGGGGDSSSNTPSHSNPDSPVTLEQTPTSCPSPEDATSASGDAPSSAPVGGDVDVTPPAALMCASSFVALSATSSSSSAGIWRNATGHRRRGRPRGGGMGRGSKSNRDAGSPSNPNVPGVPAEGTSPAVSAGGVHRRGRGRPRLNQSGPGNQGSRTPQSLPVALGSTLKNAAGVSEETRSQYGLYK